jgi:hypothetical protein
LIVTSEDCAAPPLHVPDPPSTPTVCTGPPSVGDIPASGPAPPDPPPLPELEPAPELDGPPEVEPPLELDAPLEPPDAPELEPLELVPLPEPDALPEEEAAASVSGELSLVELLPQALAMGAAQTQEASKAPTHRGNRSGVATAHAVAGAGAFRHERSTSVPRLAR